MDIITEKIESINLLLSLINEEDVNNDQAIQANYSTVTRYLDDIFSRLALKTADPELIAKTQQEMRLDRQIAKTVYPIYYGAYQSIYYDNTDSDIWSNS